MKFLLSIILSLLIHHTTILAQNPQPAAQSGADEGEKWWAEVEVLAKNTAQLKKVRYDETNALFREIETEAWQEVSKTPSRTITEIKASLLKKAEPEFAAIKKRYDPQIAVALDKYLASLSRVNQPDVPNVPLEKATMSLKPTILFTEKARYTEAARQERVQGTVQLSIVFLRNGTIGNIAVVRGLPNGMNEEAIKVAKEIVFLPARKNRNLVTIKMLIEYVFNLI